MKRSAWIGAGIIGLFAGLISQLPLSWIGGAVPQAGPTPLSFTGTVWNGQVTGLPLSGPLNVKTRPGQFLSGGTPFEFNSQATGIDLRGKAGTKQVKDLFYRAELSVLPITDGRLTGLAGMIDVAVSEGRFGKGCESLTGTIRTDAPTRNKARLRWGGPDLSGPLSCEDGEVIANLAGQDTRTDINAVIRINMGGSYRMEATVTSVDPEAGALLPLFGFQRSGNQYTLTEQGQW